MIKLLSDLTVDNIGEIVDFCETGCLGVKAVGTLLSYGLGFEFATFWEQRTYDGELTAFISKFYGNVTIHISEDAEVEEIKEFITVIGYTSLTADIRITNSDVNGYIMTLDRGMSCTATPSERPHRFIQNDRLKDFYDQTTKNIPSQLVASYEEWLVDMSHRIRHETASTLVAVSAENENIIYSTASALAITPRCALVGAVSTVEEYRDMHFAYSCIDNICNKFFEKKIYLMCKPEMIDFYKHAGFSVDGTFATI